MTEPAFITLEQALGLHEEQIELYGGIYGVRDAGLLESALVQPQHKYLYDDAADQFDLAATYAYHLVKNHPFLDGNKRAALSVALTFLDQNGRELEFSDQEELYGQVIALVEDRVDKEQFATYLRAVAGAR